jgi:hypothetical protein
MEDEEGRELDRIDKTHQSAGFKERGLDKVKQVAATLRNKSSVKDQQYVSVPDEDGSSCECICRSYIATQLGTKGGICLGTKPTRKCRRTTGYYACNIRVWITMEMSSSAKK